MAFNSVFKGLNLQKKITDDAGQSGNARLGYYMPYFRPHMTYLIIPKLFFRI